MNHISLYKPMTDEPQHADREDEITALSEDQLLDPFHLVDEFPDICLRTAFDLVKVFGDLMKQKPSKDDRAQRAVRGIMLDFYQTIYEQNAKDVLGTTPAKGVAAKGKTAKAKKCDIDYDYAERQLARHEE